MSEKTDRELEEAETWGQSLTPSNTRIRSGREELRLRRAATKKRAISVRLDEDIIEGLRELAGEGSYQRLMNQALREWLAGQDVEEVVRRVVREELQRSHPST